MRPIGFSTGALAKGDFRRGIDLQLQRDGISAIELSALRAHEIRPLIDAIGSLPLEQFQYVSFHAPSRLGELAEEELIELLQRIPQKWPIIVHPEIIVTPARWQGFHERLCLENMDNRKPVGRTVAEMRSLFGEFPDASFCLDVGHARQIDPTMTVALQMLTQFGDRLAQIHVSEVGPAGEHLPLSGLAADAFGRLAHRVPADCALIIESVVAADRIDAELGVVGRLFAESVRAIA